MRTREARLRAIPAVVTMLAIFGMSSTWITKNGLASGVSRSSGGQVSQTGFLQWWEGAWWIFVKGFHASEFAVLALLWRRALPASVAWIVTVLFAASDEWHQSFVGARGGRWTDVVIDATGATAAILAASARGKARWWAWPLAVAIAWTVAFLFR